MELENKLIDLLYNEVSSKDEQEIRKIVENDEEAQKILRDYQEIFDEANNTSLEAPDEQWVRQMSQQLENHSTSTTPIIKIGANVYKIAATIALLAIALLGYNNYVQRELIQNVDSQLFALQNQMEQSLAESSVSTRIKAVRYSDEWESHDDEIIDLLTQTMIHDESAHVRLAAVQSLSKWSETENVKIKLIEALGREDDPSIQILLIDVLSALKDQNIESHFDDLINKEDTPQYIKEEAHKGKFNLEIY